MTVKYGTSKIILIIISTLTISMGILIWFIPSCIFPDPSWGFQVMRSMQMGGGFNLLIGPDPDDIAKNTATFLSWWSPGQYLVPYFFKTVLTVNSAHATALTTTLGNLSGVAGFYFFFKKIGFTKMVANLSIAFIVLQQAYWMPFAYYNGGEVLIFAFEGWFLYGCISFKKPDVKLIAFVLFSGWIGFFCKSSFIWIYASGLICLWIRLSAGQINVWGWIKNGLWVGIPAAISVIIIYTQYIIKGDNPIASSNGFKLTFEAIGFPLASPLLAGFSVDDMLNGVVANIAGPSFTYIQSMLMLALFIALSILLIIVLIRYVPNRDYRLFIIVFYGMALLFFGHSFLWQAAISYEARHLRIIGILTAPGMIYLLTNARLIYRVTFLLVCGVIGYKTGRYIINTPRVNRMAAHGVSGLSQVFIDQPSLNYILSLDKQKTNALFVFISPSIGLEIQHNRIITLDPYNPQITKDNMVPYPGHAGTVYMVLPANYTGLKLETMFMYLPGYKDFTATRLSNKYVLYMAQ